MKSNKKVVSVVLREVGVFGKDYMLPAIMKYVQDRFMKSDE